MTTITPSPPSREDYENDGCTRFIPSDETPMTPPKQLTAVSARVLVQLSPVQLTGVSARTSHLRLKNSNYEEGKISRF